MYRAGILLFLAAPFFGQDTAFDRLKREALRVKAAPEKKHSVAQVAPLHLALRDWIEAHLPPDKASMPDSFSSIEAGLQAALKVAGLTGDLADDDDITPGYAEVEFHQFPELPDTLLVTAGASIPCGYDNAVYGYQFGAARTRALEYHPGGFDNPEMELSAPDAEGRRVLLMHSLSVQCQSTWMGLAYSAYRFGLLTGPPEKLLSVEHGFWYGNVDGPEFYLEPNGMVVEFLDASVDAIVHNRTQVYRYLFGDGVTRLDPVAFQPQDFVEEWLTRPWEEMQSRSMPETKEAHERLHAGNYSSVASCATMPGRWLIVFNIDDTEKAYFLVHELGQYRYQMESVGETAPKSCLGEGEPSDKHPWLSPSEIWSLPR